MTFSGNKTLPNAVADPRYADILLGEIFAKNYLEMTEIEPRRRKGLRIPIVSLRSDNRK